MSKILTVMGDPQSINHAFGKVLKDNPTMRVISMCTGPWTLNPNNPQIKALNPQPVLVHVLYIVYDGTTGDLVNEKGESIEPK